MTMGEFLWYWPGGHWPLTEESNVRVNSIQDEPREALRNLHTIVVCWRILWASELCYALLERQRAVRDWTKPLKTATWCNLVKWTLTCGPLFRDTLIRLTGQVRSLREHLTRLLDCYLPPISSCCQYRPIVMPSSSCTISIVLRRLQCDKTFSKVYPGTERIPSLFYCKCSKFNMTRRNRLPEVKGWLGRLSEFLAHSFSIKTGNHEGINSIRTDNTLRVLPWPLRHSGVDIQYISPNWEGHKKRSMITCAMRFYQDYITIKRSLPKDVSGDTPWQQKEHIL